jgi:hypothetical protein
MKQLFDRIAETTLRATERRAKKTIRDAVKKMAASCAGGQ